MDLGVEITFQRDDTVFVDALIGCDGIKGLSREVVLKRRWPEQVAAKYCNTYIYRGIVPMSEAKQILGEHAGNAKWFLSKGRTVACYPISKGREVNYVFFVTDRKGWTSKQEAIECTKQEMIEDLQGFDEKLLKLLEWARPLRWPVFHHPDTPAYYDGRICLLGDVAHASSPGQAAGAGQGLEDAVVLAHLLSLVQEPGQLSKAFESYDAVRRPRAQAVVRTSQEAGEMYAWNDPLIGDNMAGIVANGNERLHWIWQHNLAGDVQKAEESFLSAIAHYSRAQL